MLTWQTITGISDHQNVNIKMIPKNSKQNKILQIWKNDHMKMKNDNKNENLNYLREKL
jgi:hypothetical protein